MEDLAGVPVGSLDGSEPPTEGAFAPSFGDIPVPRFDRRRRAPGVTFGVEPARQPEPVTSSSTSNSEELLQGDGTEGSSQSVDSGRAGYTVQPGDRYVNASSQNSQTMSPMGRGIDPWLQHDPWQTWETNAAENWSDGDSASATSQWSTSSWNGSYTGWNNWDWKTHRTSDYDTNSNWSWRSSSWEDWRGLGQVHPSPEVHDDDSEVRLGQEPRLGHRLRHDSGQGRSDGGDRAGGDPGSPMATVVAKDSVNRPNGEVVSHQ